MYLKKTLFAVVALTSSLGMALWAGASTSLDDLISARLNPVGKVCVQGEECASETPAAMATTGGAAAGKAPEDIYNQNCAACHTVGVAGAPVWANAEQWAPRLDKGIDVLYDSVINGLAPGMPAKGLCMTCTDDELKAVTDYMVAAVEQ